MLLINLSSVSRYLGGSRQCPRCARTAGWLCPPAVAGTGFVQALENVPSFLVCTFRFFSEQLQEAELRKCFFSPEGLRGALPPGTALSSSSATVPSSFNEGYIADVFAQASSPAFCLFSSSHKPGLKAEAWVSARCPKVAPDQQRREITGGPGWLHGPHIKGDISLPLLPKSFPGT